MKGEGKYLVILGAGESGVGTAILGKKHGWNVFVSDFGVISPEYKEELNQYEIAWEEGKHTIEVLKGADIVVKSPGIPDADYDNRKHDWPKSAFPGIERIFLFD